MQLPNDAEGQHWGLTVDGQLVSVISLFSDGPVVQFRKFATDPAHQGQGYGSALLRQVLQLARQTGARQVWCHARQTAVGFYQKLGLAVAGEPFQRDGLAYVRMEVNWPVEAAYSIE
ncbi:MAG: GNAT family N-acetyltransferase [Bernardetiaceae bacterium]|nr:GNAT family N-acetyltransferase [Bernardetiaceae bacterium]